MNEKIILTGSSGFIGQNLYKFLHESNYVVSEVTLRDKVWKNKISNLNILINLVGKAHDHKGIASEEDYYYANFQLTKEVFSTFVNSDANLFIHISSLAAVEEFEANIPLTEESDCKPSSWYGKSKRAAEIWLMEQELENNKKLIIIRPPMVHGPGDKGNLGLLYKFVSKGIPYPLVSFNNQRSFISIDNFNFFILEILKNYDGIDTGIYNIADDEFISTIEIIQIMKDATGKNAPNLAFPKFIVKVLANVGDFIPFPLNTRRLKKMVSNLLVSNIKIKKALKIDKLPFTAREGLIKTIKSFNIERI